METVLKAIADWIKGILTAGIMSNLSGLFDAVNEQVGDIAQQVGTRPSAFEPRVFAMIESLSRNVVLPIAGIILTFIACYELIEMITQHNNMAQFEPALIMRWIFKTAVSVWFISNTFDIVMAVFDLTQKVVSDSSGIIAGNTRVNEIGLSMLEASLMQMDRVFATTAPNQPAVNISKRVTARKDRWVSPLYWTGSYRSACVSLSSRSVKRDFIRKATAFAPIGHRNMQSGVSSMS